MANISLNQSRLGDYGTQSGRYSYLLTEEDTLSSFSPLFQSIDVSRFYFKPNFQNWLPKVFIPLLLMYNTGYFEFFFFFTFLFIFETERDRAWMEEGQRERETQDWKQAPGSEPSAQSPTRGSNSRTARSWPGWSRMLNRLRHPGAPNVLDFKKV